MAGVSFAITVCNEANELKRLLDQLKSCLLKEDEIVIQVDLDNTNQKVLDIVSKEENVVKVFVNSFGNISSLNDNIKKHCHKNNIMLLNVNSEIDLSKISELRK
jgi:hypothetical protein